jgi:hypothetical protein
MATECVHCSEDILGDGDKVTCDVCYNDFHVWCFKDQGGLIECSCCGSAICGDCHEEREAMAQEENWTPDIQFYDPGGRSALRAGVRTEPCPTCHEPNRLTKEDVRLGYQCDECADQLERGY